MKKVIRNINNDVIIEPYKDIPYKQFDQQHYYVYYSAKPDEDGQYTVYTSEYHFGITKVLESYLDQAEAVRSAKAINEAIRLLAR